MLDDLLEPAPPGADLFDGNYVLGDIVGSGGMGIVYSAVQVSLRRRVAIKIPRAELATDPFVIRRFKTEALAGGRLDHRNIARVIDFGDRDGGLFLVMEYVGGAGLDKLVGEQGPMGTTLAANLTGQILAALDEAHTSGIIHADIKSANVLVEPQCDGALLARVIDFGLARFRDEPSTHDNRLLSGTPEYLAPELIAGGPPTVASDIYAAGVVLYELLTGATPFGGGSCVEILARQLDDVVVPPSLRCPDHDLPPALEAVVMCALEKDPSDRYATAALFAAALRDATPVETQSPRIARGTLPVFSSESSTCDWQREQVPPRRPATRSIAGESARVREIRDVLGEAIARGDGDSIVTSYLELVRILVDDHELAVAVVELERGLELLRPYTFTAMWRLQLCLAALYSGRGDRVRARGAARLGQADAIRASSDLGRDRAHELLARLDRHGNVASPGMRPRRS